MNIARIEELKEYLEHNAKHGYEQTLPSDDFAKDIVELCTAEIERQSVTSDSVQQAIEHIESDIENMQVVNNVIRKEITKYSSDARRESLEFDIEDNLKAITEQHLIVTALRHMKGE